MSETPTNPLEHSSPQDESELNRASTEFDAPADPFATVDPLETISPDLETDPLATNDFGDLANLAYDAANSTTEPISEPQLAQIRSVCQEFSSAWEEGTEEPSIEQHLPADLDATAVPRLVHQLVRLDIEYREQRGLALDLSAYLSRLAGYSDAVRSAFARSRSTVPDGYGSVTVPQRKRTAEAIQHPNDSSSRYQPIDFHARGGLGVVYVAVDGELERLVALKEILREHGEKPRYQEKFVFEAQLTGALEHPGIVPVYGLGRYKDQQPFYAMRFIEGHSLKNAIEQFHRSHPRLTSGLYFAGDFRALLRRLIDACNAVHYAHDRGVVHRDIKPANVMLGNYGETLVVDWGLAMLVQPPSADSSGNTNIRPIKLSSGGISGTEGLTVGTPMYMSPEQARGEHRRLDRRSDVYSLGVLLFNMVTGKHAVDGASTREVVLNVCRGNTKQVTEIAPHAPGALGSICRKAMELEADSRYSTALELAEEVDRWIDSEQVHAHIGHEAIVERSGRLIRRHWNWAIPVAIALVVITSGAIVAAMMIHSAKVEARTYKKEAVDRYRDSRGAIDTWLVQSADALEFLPGTRAVRKRLLEVATEDYKKLSQRSSGDPELELERGRALVRLGDLVRVQQDFDKARSHYDAAQTLFSAGATDALLSVHYRAEEGNVHARLGLAYADQERIADAKQQYAIAIQTLSRLIRETDDALPLRLLAAVHVNDGELLARVGETGRAVTSLQTALTSYAALKDPDGSVQLGIARAQELLGRVYTAEGEYEKGTLALDTAIRELNARVSIDPDHPEYLDALASAYVSKATSYRTRGMEQPQFDALGAAIQSYRQLNQAIPEHPMYTRNLAITLVDMGVALQEAALNQEAEKHLNEANDLLSDLVAAYGQVPRFHEDLATCRNARGRMLLDLDSNTAEATRLLALATQSFDQLSQLDPDRSDYIQRMAVAQSHYAEAVSRQNQDPRGDFENAISALQQLISRDGEKPAFSDALASIHYRFAMVLHQRDDDTEARIHFSDARDIWIGIRQGRTARMADQLAWLLATCPDASMVDIEQSRHHADQAVSMAPENPRFMTTQALACTLQGNAALAVTTLQRCKSIRGNWIDRDLFVLAMAQDFNGQAEEAQRSFDSGVRWMDDKEPLNLDIRLLRGICESALQ